MYDDDTVEIVPEVWGVTKRYWYALVSIVDDWFVSKPVKLTPEPTKPVALTTPEIFAFPLTFNLSVRTVVPIPTE